MSRTFHVVSFGAPERQRHWGRNCCQKGMKSDISLMAAGFSVVTRLLETAQDSRCKFIGFGISFYRNFRKRALALILIILKLTMSWPSIAEDPLAYTRPWTWEQEINYSSSKHLCLTRVHWSVCMVKSMHMTQQCFFLAWTNQYLTVFR